MGNDLSDSPKVIAATDPGFPKRFSDLPKPPRSLWVRGNLPSPDLSLVAVVGSRAATARGVSRISRLAGDLTAAGLGVISGGALGIDAAAHRGALAVSGATWAVLGCGIDQVYPDRHVRLFADIVDKGGALLSEFGPGVPPRKWQFPSRNRLVAALARVVVVGESRSGSGALITVRLAQELGRPVLALPGSMGTNHLLATGAALPIEKAADVLDLLAGRPIFAERKPSPFAPLLVVLADGRLPAEVIARRMNISLAETLGTLSEAELAGMVVRAPGGNFEARFKTGCEASRGH